MPKRAIQPTPVPCAPVGALSAPDYDRSTCPSGHAYACECGEALRFQYDATGLDGSYVDDSGVSIVSLAPELWKRDPKAFIEELQRTNMAAYSAWSAAYNLGMWPAHHLHRPVSCAHLPHKPSTLPWCCEMPMYLARDGWRCRVSKTLFPFAEEAEQAA